MRHFFTKFITGLKKEIQRAIRLHNPRTVDAALVLAEKQEEMLDELKMYSNSKYKSDYKQSYARIGFPGKGIISPTPNDTMKTSEDKQRRGQWDDKLKTLRDQRRARGECFTCGEKFHPGHKGRRSSRLRGRHSSAWFDSTTPRKGIRRRGKGFDGAGEEDRATGRADFILVSIFSEVAETEHFSLWSV